VEGLAPVVPNGWDADGQPVGMPWAEIRKPLVEIAAVSEDQVDTNTWSPLLDILTRGPVIDAYPGLEPMAGFVQLPYGRIQKRTAAAGSAKGAPAVFVVCDQTEEWTTSNGGIKLFNTLRNNVIKRGGHLLESPNAFIPGLGSVAENSSQAHGLMMAGKTRDETGLMYDHREAPPETDMADADSLMAGLAVAYGDSADVDQCAIHNPPCRRPGWVDLGHIRSSIWDPDADPQVSRSDFLNQVTHASDSWLSQPEWAACGPQSDGEFRVVHDRDPVVLGFDGSRKRARGVTDATALIGCRVSDGHLFEIEVWEQPTTPGHDDWEVPVTLVDAKVRETFARHNVVGFYADPAKWESYIAAWEAAFGARLKVKSTRDHPIEWWMTGGRAASTVRALEQFHSAVVDRELSHDGSSTLARHVVNARRRTSRSGLQIAKEHPDSPRKIDAAVAAVLAWQARLDALAAGVGSRSAPRIAVPWLVGAAAVQADDRPGAWRDPHAGAAHGPVVELLHRERAAAPLHRRPQARHTGVPADGPGELRRAGHRRDAGPDDAARRPHRRRR
jgi:hypothetical protein